MSLIVLTGGGTAGHVTPNIALVPALLEMGFDISYIGSFTGIEKTLIEKEGIPYYGISTGKLRRYIDPKNLTDPFRVLKGFFDARRILKGLKPSIVFSKGGFVAVPVVWAAKTLGIPCIIHESDMTPGLANKLCIPFAKYMCCNFSETKELMKGRKVLVTGLPIRASLLEGNGRRGRELCGFSDESKPVILAMGGSLGALALNKALRLALPKLLERYYVAHICGAGKQDNTLLPTEGYKQFEYVGDEMGDLLAMADIVVSRAGANAICELLALKKPALLIPLPAKSSRGDQIKNAESFVRRGYSLTLDEDDMSEISLEKKIGELYEKRAELTANMEKGYTGDCISVISRLIQKTAR